VRGISWLGPEPVSFSRRTLLHGVSKYLVVLIHLPSIYRCFTSCSMFLWYWVPSEHRCPIGPLSLGTVIISDWLHCQCVVILLPCVYLVAWKLEKCVSVWVLHYLTSICESSALFIRLGKFLVVQNDICFTTVLRGKNIKIFMAVIVYNILKFFE